MRVIWLSLSSKNLVALTFSPKPTVFECVCPTRRSSQSVLRLLREPGSSLSHCPGPCSPTLSLLPCLGSNIEHPSLTKIPSHFSDPFLETQNLESLFLKAFSGSFSYTKHTTNFKMPIATNTSALKGPLLKVLAL